MKESQEIQKAPLDGVSGCRETEFRRRSNVGGGTPSPQATVTVISSETLIMSSTGQFCSVTVMWLLTE